MSFPPTVPPARIMADYQRALESGSALPGGPTDPGGG